MNQVADANNILNAALDYANRGWNVLPLWPKDKSPLGKLVPNGHKNATTDSNLILTWWNRFPDANVGIQCGPESNLLVIDIDNKNNKTGNISFLNLQSEFGALPNTYIETTATGGFHLLFRFPSELLDKPRRAEFRPNCGVDIKSKGYIVAAPSVLDNGEYQVAADIPIASLPNAWIAACIKPPKEIRDTIRRESRGGSTICQTHGITLQDVMDFPVGIRRAGGGYVCAHPLHGSTGGGNLTISTDKNVWHCWRHDTGGDPLIWLAIREGYISCEDAGPLDKETVLKCLRKLEQEGLIVTENKSKQRLRRGSRRIRGILND